MSLISKALKKIQDARLSKEDQKVGGIVYLTDAPQSMPKTIFMTFLFLGTIAAIIIGTTAIFFSLRNTVSRQSQVLTLENTIKAQDKRINELISAINKNQSFADSQMRSLKNQISNLKSTDNDHYSNLKDAILSDKEDIAYLENYTKALKQRIEALSVASTQAQNVTSSASGN